MIMMTIFYRLREHCSEDGVWSVHNDPVRRDRDPADPVDDRAPRRLHGDRVSIRLQEHHLSPVLSSVQPPPSSSPPSRPRPVHAGNDVIRRREAVADVGSPALAAIQPGDAAWRRSGRDRDGSGGEGRRAGSGRSDGPGRWRDGSADTGPHVAAGDDGRVAAGRRVRQSSQVVPRYRRMEARNNERTVHRG